MIELNQQEIMAELISNYLATVTDDILDTLANNCQDDYDFEQLDRLKAVRDWCLENENSSLF